MLNLDIPGGPTLALAHLVLDYNGTVAEGGAVLPGVLERLARLGADLQVHLVTADTHGNARQQCREAAELKIHLIGAGDQAAQKAAYVRALGAERCVALGNGRNDALMLREAALGVALVQADGAAVAALVSADVCFRDVREALDALLRPDTLRATLRA